MRHQRNILVIMILIGLCQSLFASTSKTSSVRMAPLFNKQIPLEIDFGNTVQSEIALLRDFGFILVEIFLNAQGPYRFLVDTGSDTSILSHDMVNKLNVKPVKTHKRIFHTTHNKAEVDTFLYNIEQLKMGDVKFLQVPFIASNTASDDFQLLKELNIMGIIGANIFHDIILTLNLSQQKMLLNKKQNSKNEFQNIIKFQHEYYLPIIKTTVINNKETVHYDFLIDTGYTGFVQMPICFPYHEHHNENDVTSFDVFKGENTGFLSELDGVWMIGNNKIENPMVKYSLGACEKPHKWGLIGTRFLEHHTVTIDQGKREVILH